MKILNLFETDEQEFWLGKIGESDWRAAQFLCSMIRENTFTKMVGEDPKVLLLTEGDQLIAFCTYARYDDITDHSISPWAGFVYTFPQFRGKRRAGKLLEHAYLLAKKDGYPALYISTDATGLYENYGFSFWKEMENMDGDFSRVYKKEITDPDYSGIIGKPVKGTVDRPAGTAHPDHPNMIYPINYGYVDGIFAPDGEEQDVYIFGTEEQLTTFEGTVTGVIHRLNDNEDKWIVSIGPDVPGEKEILEKTAFQEQYYMGELYLD